MNLSGACKLSSQFQRTGSADYANVRRKKSALICGSFKNGVLPGEGMNAAYDKELVKRLDEVENLPAEEKQRIFHYMDLVIRDYKAKSAYSH